VVAPARHHLGAGKRPRLFRTLDEPGDRGGRDLGRLTGRFDTGRGGAQAHHVGRDVAGVEVVAAHARCADLGVQHPDDLVRRGLRHRVADAPRPRRPRIECRRSRRDVDDDAVTAFDHRRKQAAHEQHGMHRVGAHRQLDEVDGHVERRVVEAGPLVHGVVDDDVDASERIERRAGRALDRLARRQVERGRGDPSAERCALARDRVERTGQRDAGDRVADASALEGGATVDRSRGDDEVEACHGERHRGRPADAPARPGDQRHPSLPHREQTVRCASWATRCGRRAEARCASTTGS
jgi:hypothetical protein